MDVSKIPRLASWMASSSPEPLPMWTPATRSTGTGHLRLPHRLGFLCGLSRTARSRGQWLVPIQPAQSPDIDVGHEDERDKHDHLHEPEQPQLAHRDGPREQEDGLDVED